MRFAKFLTVRNTAPLLLGVFCLVLCVVDASSATEMDGPKPEVIALLCEFNRAPDQGNWINENQSRLSQSMLDEIERHANNWLHAGVPRMTFIANSLLSLTYRAKGDRRKFFEKYVDAWEAGGIKAKSLADYEEVYESARKAAVTVDQSVTPEYRFKASVIATEACYNAANNSADDWKTRRVWEARGLDGLVESARLADHASPFMFERIVNLSVMILRDALEELSYGGNLDHRATRLKELSSLLETSVPVGFVFRLLPRGSHVDDQEVAYTLAALSHEYGDGAAAAARLRDIE